MEMTSEELERFEEFKKQQDALTKAAKEKEDREAYRNLVDEMLEKAARDLLRTSRILSGVKENAMRESRKAIEIKAQIFGMEKLDNCSHTFTHTDGTIRATYGQYMNDGYADTVNEGIKMVKDSIADMATDDNSRALVNTILRLLSKDKEGNLKASKVLQLQKTADESGNELLKRGVRIIRESYQPAPSKTFIRMEVRNEKDGEWKSVPLGMTEA